MRFIKPHLHSQGQREIRGYAEAMLKLIAPVAPASVVAFRENVLGIYNNAMNRLVNKVKIVSSIELVDIINSAREAGMAVLQHSTFMAKIKKVIGIDEQKFLSIYKDTMNRNKPCFFLPKREASLMVMSESYEVHRRSTELLLRLRSIFIRRAYKMNALFFLLL